ncbi:MAG: hypothetical protein QXW10_03990 [Candidatus Micrarchaeaceae archaeon]
MDIQKDKDYDAICRMAARNMRFDYAERAMKELIALDRDFEMVLKYTANDIAYLKHMVDQEEEMKYDPAAFINSLNKHTGKLLNAINKIYSEVYDKATSNINTLINAYVGGIIDGKGGEIHTKKEYAKKLAELSAEPDSEEKSKMLAYIHKDRSVIDEARRTAIKNHKEYYYAINEGSDGRQVQTMQSIFQAKELSGIADINFEKLEKLSEYAKRYMGFSGSEAVDNALGNLDELKGMRDYMLSFCSNIGSSVGWDAKGEQEPYRTVFRR